MNDVCGRHLVLLVFGKYWLLFTPTVITVEEVLAYEQGYQCQDMIFCYDESYVIISAMTKYKSGAMYYFAVKAYKTYKKNTYTSSSSSKKVVIK